MVLVWRRRGSANGQEPRHIKMRLLAEQASWFMYGSDVVPQTGRSRIGLEMPMVVKQVSWFLYGFGVAPQASRNHIGSEMPLLVEHPPMFLYRSDEAPLAGRNRIVSNKTQVWQPTMASERGAARGRLRVVC